ncbi:MAG: hypothetical protein K6G10_07515 [Butyrivibrio sp.]|nr:hypothetical protein [Butyrivibrio sp.]
MNKYNEVMDKVRVDDDMRKRILENMEKEMMAEPSKGKVIRMSDKKKYRSILRYAGWAAAAVILFAGTTVVMQNSGKNHMDSATVSYEAQPASDMAAPMEAAEGAMAEEAYDEVEEAEAEMAIETETEEAMVAENEADAEKAEAPETADDTTLAGQANLASDTAKQEIEKEDQADSAQKEHFPVAVVVVALLVAIAAGLLAAVVLRKRKRS